ncbi:MULTISPECIES: zinc metalloprotease HtpX [Actinomadura]|jgi:heat shock protein HtpX|uniref:Protease HtpX homolog n=1 Tax=Actinomadura montaniterrae TaxID=1803903 RepID=A0A6L3VH15_9ACTN|nr:zinc metalloprotease HtpX [Actinomadura montaniterrae]KAB2367620.1 zinc metalloprotease HtpX [Actinomadura montaniterrae]HEU5027707.1 zinc metalloprotease HtpX [Spirillospora sp.]
MASTRYASDRGLTSRMLVTMFLLGLVYVVFVTAFFVIAPKFGVIALVIALAFLFAQYFFSDKLTMFAMHGREVSPEEAPELHGVIDRICAMSDAPKPRVAVADTDVPNAFATGRNQKKAVVCVTTGLLRRLDPVELEGVLAHEMAHVAHKDVAVMTIASFLGICAGLITRFGLEWGLWGGFNRRDNDQNTGMILLAVVAVSAVAYAISFLLTRALSRYRELSADRAAALLTGRPSALASALTKVSGEIARIPTNDLRQAQAFNAFFFTPAFGKGFTISHLFSTHPPLDKRLAQLSKISDQLSRGV